MAKVKHNVANQTACLCPVCPVQTASSCVNQRKESGWGEMRKSAIAGVLENYPEHPETYDMPIGELQKSSVGKENQAELITKDNMIELYCSVGRSECGDLHGQQRCVCPDCAVWSGHDLKASYYCLKGSAEQIERKAA